MRRIGPVALVAFSVLAIAASALAANRDPQERHTAADMARARSVLLKRSDLTAGWTATRQDDSSDDDVECSQMDIDESHLVETGSAESPRFNYGPLLAVSQGAAVYRTAREAIVSWNLLVRPQLAACMSEVLDGMEVSGVRFDVIRSSRVPFPTVAPKTAAYRLRATLTVEGMALPVQVDWVFLGHGRTLTSIFFMGTKDPVPASFEREVAGVVAERLARAAER